MPKKKLFEIGQKNSAQQRQHGKKRANLGKREGEPRTEQKTKKERREGTPGSGRSNPFWWLIDLKGGQVGANVASKNAAIVGRFREMSLVGGIETTDKCFWRRSTLTLQ